MSNISIRGKYIREITFWVIAKTGNNAIIFIILNLNNLKKRK